MALFQYAGVGSRSTPSLALHAIHDLASHLQVMGFTCRSGGAAGADTAFATGAHPAIISILPWEGYRTQAPGEKVYLAPNDSDAQASVDRFHPAPHRLRAVAARIPARRRSHRRDRHRRCSRFVRHSAAAGDGPGCISPGTGRGPVRDP